jgi:hypothetical protein
MLELAPLDENACNHEQTRAALKMANENFRALQQALATLIAEVEELKQKCPRPT